MRTAVYAFVWFALSSIGWSQGYFFFSNRELRQGIDAPVFDAQDTRLSGTDYLAALYVGPTANSLQPALALGSGRVAIQPFRTNAAAGYIVSEVADARNVVGGTLVWVQMRAWDARLGATYDEVQQLGLGGYGESNLFQTRAGQGTGAGVDSEFLVGLESFSLRAVIPEPSAVNLFAVALPVLWLASRRRRRSQQAIGHDSTDNM